MIKQGYRLKVCIKRFIYECWLEYTLLLYLKNISALVEVIASN